MDVDAPRLLHNMSQNTKKKQNRGDHEIPFKSTLFMQK